MNNLGGMVTSREYVGITDRSKHIDEVKRELQRIINAQPTQIHPDDRAAFLQAILDDLADTPSAPWAVWPSDVYLLSLTAVKTLGRNPIGSEGLYTEKNYPTLLFHSSLPVSLPTSPFSHTPPASTSPHALEAMRVLANLGVQHPKGRKRLAEFGGARAIARAFDGRDVDGNHVVSEEEEDCVDRLFLLARLGFVVTIDREDAVRSMVDKENIIENLVHFLINTPVIPSNFNALNDLLKFINNILRYYPFSEPSQNRTVSHDFDEKWDERFDNLLWATLTLFHTIPFNDLAPPLSHCLHVLLSVPWIPRLLPMWHAVPADPPSPSGGMRGLLNRLSNISNMSSISATSLSRKSSSESGVSNGATHDKGNLAIPRTRTPTPPTTSSRKRALILPPRKEASTAFVARVVKVLDTVLDRWLPYPAGPDDMKYEDDVIMDEHLPPIFLLLARAADGSSPSRKYLKDLLFPSNLDRSPEAGPLEKRKGLLGSLLRFMACTNHPQCQNSSGELLWSICDGDASTFNAEIGYGNAAGFLFLKGVSGVPQGKVETINEIGTASQPSEQKTTSTGSTARHPITALDNSKDTTPLLSEMTDEEKEREAERLFDVFDRMDRNPVISTQGPDGQRQSVKDALSAKYVEKEKEFEDKEENARREQDEKDEEEALRDYRAYLERKRNKTGM